MGKRKIKKLISTDLDNSMPPTSFDYVIDERRCEKRITPDKLALTVAISVSSLVVLLPVVIFLMAAIRVGNTHKELSREYSLRELKAIEERTFRRANSFTYPSGRYESVDEEYKEAVNSFAYQVYNEASFDKNGSFAPLSTYFNLDLLSEGISDDEVSSNMDSLLGASKEIRDANFRKAFLTNREKGGPRTSHIEMYNGAFMDGEFEYDESVLSKYTSKYCEAYYANFSDSRDVDKILNWANYKASSKAARFSKEDLGLTLDSSFLLMSTFDFSGKWGFDKTKTKEGSFLGLDGVETKAMFMNEEYYASAYEYDGYWSFKADFYGGYSIQFLTPNKREDNIYELLKNDGRNFLVEDEAKRYVPESHKNYPNSRYVIELSLPKFESQSTFSMTEPLSKLGLGELYRQEDDNKVLSGLYKNPDSLEYAYAQETKQKNYVFWDEDGATATSITFSLGAGAAASMPSSNGVSFKLDSPFVYVIRDYNNLPVFMGNVDRP